MNAPLHHPDEGRSNTIRDHLAELEPQAQRTFTPTLAVLAHSAGIYHAILTYGDASAKSSTSPNFATAPQNDWIVCHVPTVRIAV